MASKNVEYNIVCNTDKTVSAINKVVAETKKMKETTADVNNKLKDLSKNGGSAQSVFQKIGTSIGMSNTSLLKYGTGLNNILAIVGKFSGAITIAVGAVKGFEQVIRGSQTTSDEFDAAMRACTTTTQAFFTALSTNNWSAFSNGIDMLINKAKDAYVALDQLGNTLISWDYFSSKFNTQFNEQMTIARDKTKSKQERDAAINEARKIFEKQKEAATTTENTVIDAVKAIVVETNGYLNKNDISMADVERVLWIDVAKDRDEVKDQLTKGYKDFEKKYKELSKNEKYLKEEEYIKFAGTENAMKFKRKVLDTSNPEVKALFDSYKDSLLYNEILVKKDDDWLKELTANMAKVSAARLSSTTMERQLNKTSDFVNKTFTYTNLNDPELSVNKIQDNLKYLQEKFNSATSDEERKKQQGLIYQNKLALKKITGEGTSNTSAPVKVDDKEIKKGIVYNESGGIVLPISLALDGKKTKAQLEAELNDLNLRAKWEEEHGSPEGFKAVDTARKKKQTEVDNWSSQNSNIYNDYAASLPEDPFLEKNTNALEYLATINELIKARERLTEAENAKKTKKDALTKNAGDASTALYALSDAFDVMGEQSEAMKGFSKTLALAGAIAGFVAKLNTCTTVWEYIAAAATGFATIAGAVMSLASFAGGGIVDGPKTMGDYNIARVNSGEMILNSSQQGRLFNMLNGAGAIGNRTVPVEREWKIKGSTLVGAIKNEMALEAKVGRKIF